MNKHPAAELLDEYGQAFKPSKRSMHFAHTGFGGESWPTCVRDKGRNVRRWLLSSDPDSVTCLACLRIMIARKSR